MEKKVRYVKFCFLNSMYYIVFWLIIYIYIILGRLVKIVIFLYVLINVSKRNFKK